MVNSGRGRPRGPSDTRERIVLAARRQFLDHGYDRATVRSIAREAGVDHAMVNYWFGSKEGLLRAALEVSVAPGEDIERVLARRPRDLATALLGTALDLWDRPEVAETFQRMVRSALADADAERVVREYIGSRLAGRLEEAIGGRDARARSAAAAAIMAGVFTTRCVLGIEPIASMDRDEVVRAMAPPLRAVLEHPGTGVRG
ncbi:TetR/AcrR family transcriptional regulator [Brachybacterium endophyticum]|uniref:TetR/AcrR family transcriptional regulator n=1 Tax=Brachybacterium endophyticum TaxID=2182385 RepID=A0A2U2RJL2_9MICO|nr:TetR/AcrR family transcriptional regulator [Brachybacterium endophyticum]PWH05974.1 TetR/AcrR family transcriptional regulator [Brachybacterium endophyticum]